MRRALARLEAATAGHYIVASSELHRVLADCCGNRVIALFVRILLHYFSAMLPRPDARFLPMLKSAHHRLVDALHLRDGTAARHELHIAFDHSRRWIRKVEVDGQQGADR
ncbi:MAG: FCD domain-containing protein [Sphingomonadaceae bacterium]|nr:FCD domain-containing protein [Sphingomonadaceae bacterium]